MLQAIIHPGWPAVPLVSPVVKPPPCAAGSPDLGIRELRKMLVSVREKLDCGFVAWRRHPRSTYGQNPRSLGSYGAQTKIRCATGCLWCKVSGRHMDDPQHLRPVRPGQPVVLVAEDETMICNIVRIALEAMGLFVLAANDGQEALALSRKFPGTIHALVSDI